MAEGGGLLNRYRINSPIVGSNPIPSATYSIQPNKMIVLHVGCSRWPTKLVGAARFVKGTWRVFRTRRARCWSTDRLHGAVATRL